MRRNCFVILVLCISIFLSGCNIIEESTISSEPSTILSATTEPEASEASSTSEDTTSSSDETEASVTYESVSAPEGLTREEIYEDVGQTLLCYWSKYYYLDNESHIYLREYSEFNETMMLEVLWLAYQLYIPTIQGQRPRIFDYCHCNDADGVLLYTIQAMHFIFGQDISAEEMMAMIPGTSEDSYVMRYDEGYDSIISARVSLIDISAEITDTNVAEGNYDFTTDCSIVSYDDTSCTYDVYWVPGSSGEHLPNGRFAPVRDIATITVTFDFDDSYDLGFIITNIQVERAP